MSRKHDDPRGKQKGAQSHAEGQHGEKAHQHFLEEIQAAGAEERSDVEQRDGERAHEHPADGGHRLFEGRHQNDPAERASDKSRLGRDVDEHGHDREDVQMRGGAGSQRGRSQGRGDEETLGGSR